MKPCNESEIVGLKSMQPSKDYYRGYDAAEKNYIRILDKIRAEIEDLDIFYDNDYFSDNRDAMFKCNDVLQIIDKYKVESEK